MRLPSPRNFLVIGMTLGGLWLVSFSAEVLRRGVEARGSGYTTPVRIVSRTIFTPGSLVEFAGRHPAVRSHEELVSLLGAEGIGRAWYAIFCTEELNAGEREDSISFVVIADVGFRFPTIQADLAALASTDRGGTGQESAAGRIVILPEALAARDPREVVPDLVEKEKAR